MAQDLLLIAIGLNGKSWQCKNCEYECKFINEATSSLVYINWSLLVMRLYFVCSQLDH